MTDYICCYFGSDWSISARGFSSARSAEQHGLYMMPMAGCFGFAVIHEDPYYEGGWALRRDESILPNIARIKRDDLCNYTITT